MPTKTLVAVGLRVPPEMANWLKAEAAKNQRSVANQTAWMLQQYREKVDPTSAKGEGPTASTVKPSVSDPTTRSKVSKDSQL